jgi:hypothetical protein
MKNKFVILGTIICCFQHQVFSQKAAEYSQPRVKSYEIDGIYTYEISGCVPGSDLAFYAEKNGSTYLKTVAADNQGKLTLAAAKDFRPAFVLNVNKRNSSGKAGSGKVSFFTGPEFSIKEMDAAYKDGTAYIQWQASANNSQNQVFEVLKSTDGQVYQPIMLLQAYAVSQAPYYCMDPAPGNTAFYKLKIRNSEDGSEYITRPVPLKNIPDIKVYPTLAGNSINIQLGVQHKNAAYNILNAEGRLICSGTLNHTNNHIMLPDIPAGGYFIRIYKGSDNLITARFSKL